MRVLAFLPVVAAVSSTHEQIESMKSTFRGVAAQGGEIDQATKNSIQQFMNIMNRTLVGALVNEAADHQQIMNARLASVEACFTARNETFAISIENASNVKDAARSAHMQCKKCQDSCSGAMLAQWPSGHNYTYDHTRHWGYEDDTAVFEAGNAHHDTQVAAASCDGDIQGEEGAWNAQQSSCATLDSHAKSLDAALTAIPDFCNDYSTTELPADRPHNTEATRGYYPWEAATGADDTVYNWFEYMDRMNTSHTNRYKNQREDCHEKRNIHMHKAKSCHHLQRVFEQAYCTWTNGIDTACHVYKGCYASAHLSWDAQKALTEAVETQLKLQQQALECALCYGHQILQNSTDLDACDRETGCVNCDALNITYTQPHTYVPCDEEQTIKPCTDAWIGQEYSCLTGQEWLPNDCTACSAATLPDWPSNASSYSFD